MTGFRLGERARMSIVLALTAASRNAHSALKQEKDAKALGMTGAEIDVARRGSSFDFQLSKAIALALATNDEQRGCAMRSGLDAEVCEEIKKIAASYIDPPQLKSA